MKQYLDFLQYILDNGTKKVDRTGVGTISIFGYQTRFNLAQGFPLITTKKVFFNGVVRELLWFIKGSTNIYDDLYPHTKIWNPWADEKGNLGPIYGYQWRKWEKFEYDNEQKNYKKGHVDQLKEVIEQIKTTPHSRRIIVNAWNVADIPKMALPPCHMMFQFYVADGRLDCQLYQRSADVAIGVPFNIASYALLQILIAEECGLRPGFFVHTFGDAHIYLNHLDGVKEQLQREPRKLPLLKAAKQSIFDIKYEDITLLNYEPHDAIKFPIAV